MFIALRDLTYARGRFALLGAVIALMTLMVVMLSGLTAGLGAASVSAITALPVDHLALQRPADGQDISFSTSSLPPTTATTIATQPGITAAHPLGISTTRLQTGNQSAAITLIGTDPTLHPTRHTGTATTNGQIAITTDLATDNNLHPGDNLHIAGHTLQISAVLDNTSFNHLPVAYTTITTWQQLTRTDTITAVATTGAAPDTNPDITTVTRDDAVNAVGAYASEQASLNLMRALLLAVSALVVGAFFTIWTIQRAPELAVIRALGASPGYLLRDALGQAAVVLILGATTGTALATALGALASRTVPFVLNTTTIAIPLTAMITIGLLGATASIRRVTRTDALTALGATR